jgi:ribose-phosphate pyrophosphokinase
MQTIDLIKCDSGFHVATFPDGEKHLFLEELDRKDEVRVVCRIKSSDDLFILMQLADILNRQEVVVSQLDIAYLMGARCDRLFSIDRPFTLKIVAEVVNRLNARHVYIVEPHSERTLEFIKNSKSIELSDFLAHELTGGGNPIFVAPDKGAQTRYNLNFGIVCQKIRDVETGKLIDFSVHGMGPAAEGRKLYLVDDLCDGGGTFVGLAPKLRALKPKELNIIITHAIQLSGIEKLAVAYDKVVISDTFKDWAPEVRHLKNVTVWNWRSNDFMRWS